MKLNTENKLPVVAIVGRPNVGKSSLFNVIMRKRISIVHEESGVTRDRVSMPTQWQDKPFLLIDTGGLGVLSKQKKNVEMFDGLIRDQLMVSVEDADLVVVVTDITAGVTPMDREVCKFLHSKGKKIIVACNKTDNPEIEGDVGLFSSLGGEEMMPISCFHKRNIQELLDVMAKYIPKAEVDTVEDPALKIAVAGRPNAGKSSIINRLLGHERVIVSEVAGTTRDAVDIPFTYKDEDGEQSNGMLIDTAGVKQRKKVDNLVDMFSMMRTEEAVQRASVVFFILDIAEGVTLNDKKICSMIIKAGRPCVIVGNKWDLYKGKKKREDVMEDIRRELPFLAYAPLLLISAKDGTAFDKILPMALEITEQARINVPTALLNQVLHDMTARTPPPSTGKGWFKIYYATMIENPPAKFVIFCNKKSYVQKSYIGFIEKNIRNAFGLTGIPIEVILKERTHLQDKFREDGGLPGSVKEKFAENQQKSRWRSKKYRRKNRN
ncbi:MAG: ribosome biogenesis GTPase Der [Lentisphaeraceae bacterium]|nr:ribosome biogenesis GTPase Der [Lentisphaeraceae bacterium]